MNFLKNRIAELRKRKKVSQSDVAKALNITRQAVSLYERGEHEPKLETWVKLAKFFNVSVAYLQGLTISENDVLKIMNDAYLSNVRDFIASHKNQKFNYSSFVKNSGLIINNISHSVDMYLLINKIVLPLNAFSIDQLTDYSKEVRAYWNKHFNFIFDDFSFRSFRHLDDMSSSEKHDLIMEIDFHISVKYLRECDTAISEYYDSQNYYHDIAMFQSNSDEIMRFNSKKKIKKQIAKMINELSSFSSKLDNLPDNPQFNIDELVKSNSTIKSH